MVLGLCRLLLHDPVEAEDATQQTFLSAHRSLLNGSRPRAPAIWLTAIARHECQRRSALRGRANVLVALDDCPEPASSAADPPTVASEHENLSDLREAIGDLPRRQRQAVVLRHFYGLSYVEVATALHVSVPVVEQLLVRARRGLRRVAGDLPRRFVTPVMVSTELRDDLVRAIPGFEPAASSAGAGVGGIALAKIASAPVVAKVAVSVATVAAIGAGAGAGLERSFEPTPDPPPVHVVAPSRTPAPAAHASTPSKDTPDPTVHQASAPDDAQPVVRVPVSSSLRTARPQSLGGHAKSRHSGVGAATSTHAAHTVARAARNGGTATKDSGPAGTAPEPASGEVGSDDTESGAPVSSAPDPGEPGTGEPVPADPGASDSGSSVSVWISLESTDALIEFALSSAGLGSSTAGGPDAEAEDPDAETDGAELDGPDEADDADD